MKGWSKSTKNIDINKNLPSRGGLTIGEKAQEVLKDFKKSFGTKPSATVAPAIQVKPYTHAEVPMSARFDIKPVPKKEVLFKKK